VDDDSGGGGGVVIIAVVGGGGTALCLCGGGLVTSVGVRGSRGVGGGSSHSDVVSGHICSGAGEA